MPQRSLPTRTLPAKPNLDQLRKQAKELLKGYQAGEQSAVIEVEQFEPNPSPANFALADAQRVIARAYGFASWTRLKQHAEGVTPAAFIAAVNAGDVTTVRNLVKARPELIKLDLADLSDSALHRAVCNRDAEMTRELMRLGTDARQGIWPHRDATSPYTIAKDRQYDEIVAVIEQEEAQWRRTLSASGATVDFKLGDVYTEIRDGRYDEAIHILQSDLSLVGSCDVHGATPLHKAASAHSPEMVAWLLTHRAAVDARDAEGRTPLDYAAAAAGWSANDHYFPYMKNARVEPSQFYDVAKLLRDHGAELTPRAAVAIGERDAVLQMHREGKLKNEVEFWGGGLVTIAVRVNRIEMVSLLLDLGFDPNEPATPTEEGSESWGFPLWFAAVCGRLDIAELLLSRGADIHAVFHASGDALGNAQETGNEEMVALLVRHGAEVAVEHVSDRETAKGILDGTIATHSLNVPDASPTDLAEQMLWASMRGDPEIVRMCLPHITRKRDDPWWNEVLVHATVSKCVQVVLSHGVDPDVANERGYTLLHHVASEHVENAVRLAFAKLLLDAGASLLKRDALLKSTPLGWACRWGRVQLIELYLECGADACEPDAEAWASPLAWAIRYGRDDIATRLRTYGAER